MANRFFGKGKQSEGDVKKIKVATEPDSADGASAEDSEELVEGSDSEDESPAREAVADAALDDELKELRTEAAENYNKYLRAVADLENFRKRSIKERSDLVRYAGEHLAGDLLEVVDNFERALAQDWDKSSKEELLKGIQLTSQQLTALLDKHSIRPQPSVGKPFDPSLHEAMATVTSEEHPPNTVIEEFKKPYFFKDKLIRPGQVVVAKAASEQDKKSAAEDAPEEKQQ